MFMSRKLLKINELIRIYNSCNNPKKEDVIVSAIDSINSLTIIPKEDKDEKD